MRVEKRGAYYGAKEMNRDQKLGASSLQLRDCVSMSRCCNSYRNWQFWYAAGGLPAISFISANTRKVIEQCRCRHMPMKAGAESSSSRSGLGENAGMPPSKCNDLWAWPPPPVASWLLCNLATQLVAPTLANHGSQSPFRVCKIAAMQNTLAEGLIMHLQLATLVCPLPLLHLRTFCQATTTNQASRL